MKELSSAGTSTPLEALFFAKLFFLLPGVEGEGMSESEALVCVVEA